MWNKYSITLLFLTSTWPMFRKNDLLPAELQDLAWNEVKYMPFDSNITRYSGTGTQSTSISDPDSGVFWIRIRNLDPNPGA